MTAPKTLQVVVAKGRCLQLPDGKVAKAGATVELDESEALRLFETGHIVDPLLDAAPEVAEGPTFTSDAGPSVKTKGKGK